MATTRTCPIRLPKRGGGHGGMYHEQVLGGRSARPQPLNILVPLGGLSSNEFVEAGYRLPKPMVPIVGRPMLLWMFDNLDLRDGDHIWVGIKREVEAKFSIGAMLRREYAELPLEVVCFDFDTRGATETLYIMLNAMDDAALARRTISLDFDTLWFCDVLGGARALPPHVGASFYFNDHGDDATAPYSYIRVDAATSRILDIREKVAISRLANNGAYVFASGRQARDGLASLLDEACASPPDAESTSTIKGLPSCGQPSWSSSCETTPPPPGATTTTAAELSSSFLADETVSMDGSLVVEDGERGRYVSGLIEHLMRKFGATFYAVLANDFANLGTPSKLRAFIARLRRGEVVGARAMRFCFGLDGTLVTPPRQTEGDDGSFSSTEEDLVNNENNFVNNASRRVPPANNGMNRTTRPSPPTSPPQKKNGHAATNERWSPSRVFATCEPIAKNIAIARELHDAGHTIIVWTDRGMRETNGSYARAAAEVGRVTFEQLELFGIPYDEVVFGKPHADVYVDARAVNPLLGDKFEDALGWDLESERLNNSDLESGVAPRHFNSIRRVGDDHVEKTGPRSVLRGEIYWYQHVPSALSDLFPHAHAVREHPAQELSSIVLARVTGVTYSHLVVNSCITPGRLKLLLTSLQRIHAYNRHNNIGHSSSSSSSSRGGDDASTNTASCTTHKEEEQQHAAAAVVAGSSTDDADVVSEALLCSNYRAKVEKRYRKHEALFKALGSSSVSREEETGSLDVSALARVVLEQLLAFQSARRYKRVDYIHGDPVFSNVMLTTDSKVKFLDMRGSLGDVLTTQGDVLYDLSKVYQSLCGYDFIILDVPKSDRALATLAALRDDVFEPWLAEHHPDVDLRDVKILTAAHFFCIVPLHENKSHQIQFLQASHTLLTEVGLL